jgi:hypothetical protein
MDDTIIVTKVGGRSIRTRSTGSDVVYFDKEYARKATKLSEQCVVVVRAPKMRAYLDRRNTTFLTTLLQPDSGSVAFADIHEFLCRLPSDTCTPLSWTWYVIKRGFSGSICM